MLPSSSTIRLWTFPAFSMTLCLSLRFTATPIPRMVSNRMFTSRTSGIFSIYTVSSVMAAAARIGSAAFLAPAISTSPTKGFPPFITYCSILFSSALGLIIQTASCLLSGPVFRTKPMLPHFPSFVNRTCIPVCGRSRAVPGSRFPGRRRTEGINPGNFPDSPGRR